MEIVKAYTQVLPPVRFIGKKYGDSDRVDGSFAFAWQKWMDEDSFMPIIEAAGGQLVLDQLYEDGNACLGLMRYKPDVPDPFQYWIGLFTPASTIVPEGYEYVDFEASHLGVCWYLGQEPDIYGKEDLAMYKLEERGHKCITDNEGAFWFFERYSPQRFNEKDSDGNVILDIGFFIA